MGYTRTNTFHIFCNQCLFSINFSAKFGLNKNPKHYIHCSPIVCPASLGLSVIYRRHILCARCAARASSLYANGMSVFIVTPNGFPCTQKHTKALDEVHMQSRSIYIGNMRTASCLSAEAKSKLEFMDAQIARAHAH